MSIDFWLKEVKERCEKATKGPWNFSTDLGNRKSGYRFDSKDDVIFISNSRTDLPRAIRLIEKYREALEIIYTSSELSLYFDDEERELLNYTGEE